MDHDGYDNAYISDILNGVRTVAVVGASANDVRPSFFVTKYLLDKGFAVHPINPGHAGQVLRGRKEDLLPDIKLPFDLNNPCRGHTEIVRPAL